MKQIQYQGLYFYYLDLLLFTVFVRLFRSFNSSLSSFLLRFIQFFSLLGNNGTTTNSWNLVHTNSDRSVFHFVQPIRLDKILTSSTISLHLMLSLLSMPERDVPFFFSVKSFVSLVQSFFSWFIDRFCGSGAAQQHHQKRNYYILIECFNWWHLFLLMIYP